MEVGRPVRIAATGDITGADKGGTCAGGSLTAGSADATLTIREGGSGGTVLFTLKAVNAASGSIQIPGPFRYEGQLHGTLAGAGAEATFLI